MLNLKGFLGMFFVRTEKALFFVPSLQFHPAERPARVKEARRAPRSGA
jgi:hypothetical protein